MPNLTSRYVLHILELTYLNHFYNNIWVAVVKRQLYKHKKC